MRPLEDVRIIAIEQFGAGPYGSVHLADLGADVLKIEDPASGGDVARYVPPYTRGEDSLFFETFNRNKKSLSLDLRNPSGRQVFETFNRNKKSLSLDLRNPSGRQVFEDLVRSADAVYSNLRGDVPAQLAITYDDLKHLNPAIVCCSVSGFGMTGPRADQPGYDYLLQGLAGWMSLTGDPDGPPTKSGLSLVDYCGGLVGALSLLTGLHAARRDGVGGDCDVSLYDTAVSLLTYPAIWHLNKGYAPQRTRNSAHPSLVPFQAFEAQDGWFVVACAKEKFWVRLATALGLPELLADPRFADFDARDRHRDDLLPILEQRFAAQTVEHWTDVLADAGVPTGPVHDVDQALADDHTAARGLIATTDHDVWGHVRQLVSPVRFDNETSAAPPTHRRAPHRNEHFDDVMTELGYLPEHVARLIDNGAFGPRT